jgi:hypothetical protein
LRSGRSEALEFVNGLHGLVVGAGERGEKRKIVDAVELLAARPLGRAGGAGGRAAGREEAAGAGSGWGAGGTHRCGVGGGGAGAFGRFWPGVREVFSAVGGAARARFHFGWLELGKKEG